MMSIAHSWFMTTVTSMLINRKTYLFYQSFKKKKKWPIESNSLVFSLILVPVPHHVLHHLMLILTHDSNLFLQASAWISRAPWILLKWRTRKLHWPHHVCSNQSACELCPSAYPQAPPPPACARSQLSGELLLICRIIVSSVGFKMTAILILLRRLADKTSTFFK